jgi:O-antigen/teichoic acid export membrane protein
MVLARLLTPEEIGLFSVTFAFVTIGQTIRDFGIRDYLVQEPELTSTRIATAFTLTLITSTAIFLIFQIAVEPISDFYDEERLVDTFFVLSFIFLIIPFNATTFSILTREMDFTALFWIRIATTFTNVSLAIILALLDFGYMALIWSTLASTLTSAVGLFIYRKSDFWHNPTLYDWRRVISFSSRASLTNMATKISNNLNDAIIGRFLDFSSVAIFSRAQGVMYLFDRDIMQAVNNVAYPTFARAHREKGDLESHHTRSIIAITAIAWPFYGLLALYPEESIYLLFGDQWDMAIPLVPIFCLAGAIGATWKFIHEILLATGRAELVMRAELSIQSIRIFAIILCALSFNTLIAYTFAFLLVYILSTPILYYYKSKAVENRWRLKIKGLGLSLALSFLTLLIPILLKLLSIFGIIGLHGALLLFIAVISAIFSWVISLKITKHPIITDPIIPERIRGLLN